MKSSIVSRNSIFASYENVWVCNDDELQHMRVSGTWYMTGKNLIQFTDNLIQI